MKEFNGEQKSVDPRKVVVDHRYQRPENDPLITAIASDPRWELFGALVLFQRKGDAELYYCADGQQRLRGVLGSANPPRRVPAVIFSVPGLESEAEIFVRINEFRKALRPLEKHKGKTTARDQTALIVNRATQAAGFSVSDSGSSRAIGAPLALYHAYNALGEQGLVQLLTIVREAWPEDKKALASGTIKALADVLEELSSNGSFSRTKLTRKLAKTTPSTLHRRAEEIHFDTGKGKGESLRAAFREAVGSK